MKTLTTSLHILALSALLAAHMAAPAELKLPGVRKALQTMESFTFPSMGRIGA